jgi:hypothetical protein
MLDIPLPVSSYEAAIPYLRRPYLPNQVRAKIQTAPENQDAPCAIVLYANSETLMDRLNLVCGEGWDHDFDKLTEEKFSRGKGTAWYCVTTASITVFGITRADIGEGIAPTRAAAEMNARAQAYKRAGRKFGPGQCLYACEEILMWRGGDGENKLRIPTKGEDRHLYPFFDAQGVGQRYVRDRYQAWLKECGEGLFGEPLDHLQVALAIQARPTIPLIPDPNPTEIHTPSPPTTNSGANDGTQAKETDRQLTVPTITVATGAQEGVTAVAVKGNGYMPDHPAPAQAIQAAQNTGYGEPVARRLCNLARAEGQGERFTKPQLRTVENWLSVLHDLAIPEDIAIDAAGHNAEKRSTQERRQALFAQWLASKTAGEDTLEADGVAEENGGDGQASQVPAGSAVVPQPAEQATSASDTDADVSGAITVLQSKMVEHEYDDLPVTRLAALATGNGPRSQVEWEKMQPSLLFVLGELLDSAASLRWDSDRLDKEVLKAHNSNRQNSAAGRFSAFANSLKDKAETRALEVR